jgi:hypothetical protein
MQSDGKKEIWDFYPLKDDPTPEERAEMLRQAKEEQATADDDFARAVLNDFKSKELI